MSEPSTDGETVTVAKGEDAGSFEEEHREGHEGAAPPPEASGGPDHAPEGGELDREGVMTLLSEFRDPDRPQLDIVEMGLVYDVRHCGSIVSVTMTLTRRDSPHAEKMAAAVRHRLLEHPGIDHAKVEVVWDPRWNPMMISPEGRRRLGLE